MTRLGEADETLTATRRKEQVLRAAAECFGRHGFHRSSMAQIAATAGMSPGHVGYYFKKKEDIVASIVARERSEFDVLIQQAKAASRDADVVDVIVDIAQTNVDKCFDGERTALMLEILAEAMRNPDTAKLIQDNDKEARRQMCELLDEGVQVKSRCEILGALFDGLAIRKVRNPELEATLDREMLKRILHVVLTT